MKHQVSEDEDIDENGVMELQKIDLSKKLLSLFFGQFYSQVQKLVKLSFWDGQTLKTYETYAFVR